MALEILLSLMFVAIAHICDFNKNMLNNVYIYTATFTLQPDEEMEHTVMAAIAAINLCSTLHTLDVHS